MAPLGLCLGWPAPVGLTYRRPNKPISNQFLFKAVYRHPVQLPRAAQSKEPGQHRETSTGSDVVRQVILNKVRSRLRGHWVLGALKP